MGAPTGSLAKRLLLAALIVAAAGNTSAASPTPQSRPATRLDHDLSRLGEWIDAVDRHNPGKPDTSAITVGSWTAPQLETLFFDLEALLQLMAGQRPRAPRAMRAFTSPELEELADLAVREARRIVDRPARPPQLAPADAKRLANRLLKRAALLHTDIALMVPAAADRFADSSQPRRLLDLRSSVQVVDGRRVGISYYGAHWDFARLLLDEVAPDPGGDRTVLQWYRAIATLFSTRHLLAESRAHLDRARRLFPADPEIAAAQGRFFETSASPRIQNFLDTSAPAGDLTARIGSARSNLRQAETFFRKAVEIDGGFVEARLHLGRVLGLQGHHDAAATELRRVTAGDADPRTHYYAWLFLGVEEQALGRPARARESFESAAARFPRAQSPYLALSQLARRGGDRAVALRAIQHVLALPADDRDREDPWWTYLSGSDAKAQTGLSDIRATLYLTPLER